MRRQLAMAAVVSLLLAPALAALPSQQDPLPRANTGENDVFSGANAAPRTRYDEIADRLKLDAKTQGPGVQQLFSEAQTEAAPIGQRMLILRQQMVNLSLGDKPDEIKKVTDEYAAAAGQMARVEAHAFAKVYATLKPNQQGGAQQAFALMAGMFQPTAGGGGGGRRGNQPRGGGQ